MYVTVRAKFVGTDSLGYVHGETYDLIVENDTARRLDGTGACPYGSTAAFLNNWTDIVQTSMLYVPTV